MDRAIAIARQRRLHDCAVLLVAVAIRGGQCFVKTSAISDEMIFDKEVAAGKPRRSGCRNKRLVKLIVTPFPFLGVGRAAG